MHYINYAIKRGAIDPRTRSDKPGTTWTNKFMSLIRVRVENKRRKSIRKTVALLKSKQLNVSYGNVQTALKSDNLGK